MDIRMASSSQKKTTMAKLNREAALRERRARKQAKKDARKQESVGQTGDASDPPSRDENGEAPEVGGPVGSALDA
jgi:hypothetical protein